MNIPDSTGLTPRQKCELLKTQLEQIRSPRLSRWQDLADHFLPYRFRATVGQTIEARTNATLVDTTPLLVLETFSAGLLAYVSPAETDWFDLTPDNPDLSDDADSKSWCSDATDDLQLAALKSNFYPSMATVYEDLGAFGTGAMIIEDDERETFRCHPVAIGTYSIGLSEDFEVDTFSREFEYTARQLVDRFGNGKVSEAVRMAMATRRTEQKFKVAHLIYPNPDHVAGSKFKTRKPFAEKYWEVGGRPEDAFLEEGGYDEFPVVVARWAVAAEDVWGYGPGDYALADNKTLQVMYTDYLRLIANEARPAIAGPAATMQQPINLMPGGKSIDDTQGQGRQGLRRLFESSALSAAGALNQQMQEIRARIGRHYHEDLWLQIKMDSRATPPTAAEVHARFQEMARALGKPLTRLTPDALKPAVNRMFGIMARKGLFAPAPESLRPENPVTGKREGVPLRVEFTSVLAAAQRGVGTADIERYLALAAQVALIFPDSKDKTDADQLLDEAALSIGIPEKIMRSDEATAERRAAEAQAAQAAAQAERVPAMAGAARDLAQAPLDGNNALGRLVGAGT